MIYYLRDLGQRTWPLCTLVYFIYKTGMECGHED